MNSNLFEDFSLGQVIRHATPRTVTAGDVALYTALYGSRFAVQSSDAFAAAIGYRQAPQLSFLSRTNPINKLFSRHISTLQRRVKIILIVIASLLYLGIITAIFKLIVK